MSKSFSIVISALGVAICMGAFPVQGQPVLYWSDEFDGTAVDQDNWEYMFGDGTGYGLPSGWGNNELEYYTSRSENAYVIDGHLHIVAREESYAGFAYTSARLRTKDLHDFVYGKMEAKIKLPTGQGL